jgi:uncharacterized membrane protein
MRKIKGVVNAIALTAIIAPCVLILNESDSFVPNCIGIAYLVALFILAKTTKFGDFLEDLIDGINEMVDNNGRKND